MKNNKVNRCWKCGVFIGKNPHDCKEVSRKISLSLIGTKRHLGHKHSEETKKKIRIARSKQIVWNKGLKGVQKMSQESRRKLSEKLKGRIFSKEHRQNLSKQKHWNWKGGITPLNLKIRHSIEYKLWRKSVFERDNYACIWCGQRGGKLNADHIKPFALFPELRFAIDNGRTLCIDCHRKTDTFGEKVRGFK